MAVSRRVAREEVFRLLFETEFHKDAKPEEILTLAEEVREFKESPYIRETYFGTLEKMSELDEYIGRHANGWRADRIAPVLRNILRLGAYEMIYREDVPAAVALDEAIELTKTFAEEKEKAFVNGVLNGIKDEIEAK